ncbi:disintegrin and metalloproteinase domain-containing protein 9-like isoform X1 [Pogoniulus pusillus]|uniref:disintegrin and metalloproteinase domain-containing protein 9-like isoform X1 n=1 Tax=Pogoniulus pusillus TaxID=488313 RepID=UPI0030B94F7E
MPRGIAMDWARPRAQAARSCLCLLLLLLLAVPGQPHRAGFQEVSLLSSYEVVVPQRLGRERREASNVSSAQDQVSYAIEIEGQQYTIHLQQNRELLPKDFTVYTYNEEGKLQADYPDVQDHCHYQGYVEGSLDSVVAVSTCSGLRGLVMLGNITYGIEPMDSSSGSKHILYRLDNVKQEPSTCGVNSEGHAKEHTEDNHHPSMTQLLRRKRAVLHQTRYVELFIVVDKEKFEDFGKSETEVREHMVQLANFLDSMYLMLNIRIVLVGLEIWKAENIISTEGGAGDVLANFVQWREKNLVLRRRHDSAQFVLKKGFGGTAGMAYVGTVCSKSHAGGINVFGRISIQMFASIMAHELGHNLGMNHDDGRVCHCGASSCIMSSGASGSRNFSSCSAEDFEKLTLNKGGSCLLNVPRPDETYSVPYCGNRLVDAGEECDCGSPKECESDPCCEPGTCRLRSGAECAYGDCCRNCRLLPGGTECRASNNECDLPEYCNGSSQFCQPDFTVHNGHPCHNEEAYCYNGVCQYYDAQCQDIFGPKAKAAPSICFAEVNSKGDRFGNCGFHGHDYKKCSSWNAMCGKLQCENVKAMPVFGIKPAIIQTPIRGTTCWGVDFQLGSDVPDPGMVNEGTKCGNGKICRHFQCVSASVLDYDSDMEKQCHGHGVCNNNRNCHCEPGWAPPYCDHKGYGGSVDSGPPYNDKDTSLRDGLLVFFFLVLPLLVAAALAFARRDRLKRCWRRLKSRCHSSLQSPPPRTEAEPRDCQPRGFSHGMPYAPRGVPMAMEPNTYPVPSYPVPQPPQQAYQHQPPQQAYQHQPPQQAYHQPYYPSPPYQAQQPQKLPTRPPPPQQKCAPQGPPPSQQRCLPQGQYFPSRPAPLPPK